jgi:hypothetical protein
MNEVDRDKEQQTTSFNPTDSSADDDNVNYMEITRIWPEEEEEYNI